MNIEEMKLKDILQLVNILKVNEVAVKQEDMRYVIVRTYSAGVFSGNIESRNGREVVLRNARRLYYWDGASTLSELAQSGTYRPENCKFPCEVDRIELLEAIEIIDTTAKAENSIKKVKIWTQK